MSLDEIRQTKIEKVKKLKASGIDPYPAVSGRSQAIKDALINFDTFSETKKETTLAGRVMAKREHGGSIFFDIDDSSAQIQGYLKRDEIGEKDFNVFNELIDIGDFIDIAGFLFKTKKEEKTLHVKKFKILTKALLPLPEKWHGLQDVEERLRKRYLDFIFNPD